MNAVAGPAVSELEESIVDVFASLRGAASAGLVVAGYDRYVGCTDFVECDLVVEAPDGTAVTAVQSYELDAAMVDGGEWSIFQRADFTWGELVALRPWHVRKVGMIGPARPQCAEEVHRRFLERSRCRFQIPADVRYDRTFLEEARDGLLVKAMHTWLFKRSERLPMPGCDTMRNAVVDERGQRVGKTSLSMFVGAGRVISFPDYACFRGMDAHETDIRFCGNFEGPTTVVVPFYDFPVVPPVVAGVVPPSNIAVRLPRVAHYFGQTEKSQEPAVRKRYERAYVIEWAHAIAASLGLDLRIVRRVWICDSACIEFLRKIIGFPSFFVNYVSHAVTRVSFKSLVGEPSKTRALSSEYVSYRMDYATRQRSSYATMSSVTPGFIKVGSVSAGRPLVQSSREVLDTAFPDAVHLLDPAWSSALNGVPRRSEGWKIRDVMEVLLERVNRYYRKKESAEFEVDTLRARGSAVGEYDHVYKLYRYSAEEDAEDDRYEAPHDPYDPYAHRGGSSSL